MHIYHRDRQRCAREPLLVVLVVFCLWFLEAELGLAATPPLTSGAHPATRKTFFSPISFLREHFFTKKKWKSIQPAWALPPSSAWWFGAAVRR